MAKSFAKNLGKAKRNGASIASPANMSPAKTSTGGYVDSAATAHAGLKGKR